MRCALPVGRMPMAILSAAVLLVLPLCMGGCGDESADGGDAGGDPTEPVALDGTDWRLVRWREAGIDPLDFTITATFADGRIGGTSAVNTYGGPYTTGPGNDFSVGELAGTMMAGPEPDMEAEAAYLRLLDDAATVHLAGDTLTLFGSDGAESLVFSAGLEE